MRQLCKQGLFLQIMKLHVLTGGTTNSRTQMLLYKYINHFHYYECISVILSHLATMDFESVLLSRQSFLLVPRVILLLVLDPVLATGCALHL